MNVEAIVSALIGATKNKKGKKKRVKKTLRKGTRNPLEVSYKKRGGTICTTNHI